MFCKNCGSEIKDNAVFCPNCGNKNENIKSAIYNKNNGSNNKSKLLSKVLIIVCICIVIIFGIQIYNNRTCNICDNKVFKQGLCREHYSAFLIEENIKDVKTGEKSIIDAIGDTYDKGLTNAEKNRIKKSANNIKENIDDVRSGNKDIFEAAQDIYDKNLTRNEKRQIENEINDIKNSLGNLLN